MNPTEGEYSHMTVRQRLEALGMFSRWEAAAAERREDEMFAILSDAKYSPKQAKWIVSAAMSEARREPTVHSVGQAKKLTILPPGSSGFSLTVWLCLSFVVCWLGLHAFFDVRDAITSGHTYSVLEVVGIHSLVYRDSAPASFWTTIVVLSGTCILGVGLGVASAIGNVNVYLKTVKLRKASAQTTK
jgi:hypothetical protein